MKPFFLIVCNMECMGKAYSYLRLSKTVFSIFFLENDVYRLIKSFPKCKVNFINYLDDVDNPSENIQSNINYGCVFVIRQVSYYSKAIFAMFEAKVKRMIPSDFAYTYSYHLAENEYRKFMVFHHKQKIAYTNRILVIVKFNGYGDAVFSMPLLQYFAIEKRKHGLIVDFMHYYEKSYSLAPLFLNEFKNSYCMAIDNKANIFELREYKTPQLYKEYYNFDELNLHSAGTCVKETGEFLKVSFPENLLENTTLNFMNLKHEDESSFIEYKKKYRCIIGVQFYTDDDAVCAVKRSWPQNFAQDFIKRCYDSGIGVVNLAPFPGINTNNLLDFSHLKVNELFSIINRLNLIVSIDSCCSHIAGVLGIPNIVILGKALSASSQRPISMNICLISKTGTVDSIKPDFLYDFILDLLRNPYKTDRKLKSEYSFTPGPDVFWV